MNIEDDEGPDPDYGVFGDAGLPKPPPRLFSKEELQDMERVRKRREQSERASREFNSYMIDLFNRSQK